MFFLILVCLFMGACSLNTKQTKQNSRKPVPQSFAGYSSVFKIDIDKNLGESSGLLLLIDYDKEKESYNIKVLGAFASILLKAKYSLNTFTYDFAPQLLQNKQVQELFEQTIKVLITNDYNSKYECRLNECNLTLGSQMFKNKYIFSSYNKEGFAEDILCSYRRGTAKINLQLLKVS